MSSRHHNVLQCLALHHRTMVQPAADASTISINLFPLVSSAKICIDVNELYLFRNCEKQEGYPL